MKNRNKITIIGVPASPYTRKMLAVLRFKNIDYSVIWGNPNQILDSMGLKVPKPTLLPVMILNKNENDQAVCDSTPIIRELDEIYKQRNNAELELLDKNDYFLLYEIKNLEKVLPSLESEKFLVTVRDNLYERNKYDVHTDLMKKIQKKEFTNDDFFKLSKGNIKSLKINSVNDIDKFTNDSVKLLYSLGINNFSLVSDKDNNVYLVKIKNINKGFLNKDNEETKKFLIQANTNLRDNLYNSYDFLLNEKYDIDINQNTLERMKNYFK